VYFILYRARETKDCNGGGGGNNNGGVGSDQKGGGNVNIHKDDNFKVKIDWKCAW